MHSALRTWVVDNGGLSGSSGAEEDLGDPEEADRMQRLLLTSFNERYKYMQSFNQEVASPILASTH
jgi:hypothetical protein